MSDSASNFFSSSWRPAILDPLLLHVDLLYQSILDLPFPPSRSSEMAEEDLYAAVAASATIAGIRVTPAEIRGLSGKNGAGDPRFHPVRRLLATYRFLSTVETSTPFTLGEQLLCSLHRYCTGKSGAVHEHPGCYRTKPATILDRNGNAVYQPPADHGQVAGLMWQFIHWINSPSLLKLHPLLRAGLAHYHLCLLHPFPDGNGRVARLVETLILGSAGMHHLGLLLTDLYHRHEGEYFLAFTRTYQAGKDRTYFLELLLRMARRGLERIRSARLSWIGHIGLEHLYRSHRKEKKINERQHTLLTLWLEHDVRLRPGDLLESTPFFPLYRRLSLQTARRDLGKLASLGLLDRDDGGLYRLNRKILLKEGAL